jgi:hypothetical protein
MLKEERANLMSENEELYGKVNIINIIILFSFLLSSIHSLLVKVLFSYEYFLFLTAVSGHPKKN